MLVLVHLRLVLLCLRGLPELELLLWRGRGEAQLHELLLQQRRHLLLLRCQLGLVGVHGTAAVLEPAGRNDSPVHHDRFGIIYCHKKCKLCWQASMRPC